MPNLPAKLPSPCRRTYIVCKRIFLGVRVGGAGGDFRLGEWLVQPSLNRLSRGDEKVQIRPRLMDVLGFLGQHAGDVVSKDEIIAAVWARQFMAESVLTRSIAELRRVLGDKAADPRFIETVTKRGYRLFAPVEYLRERPKAVTEASAPSRKPLALGEHSCGLCWGEQEIPLAEGENIIGRTRDAIVRISSSRVSRRHAKIVVTGGRAVLEDLGSKNGTFIRGRKIHRPVELSDGDEICFGRDVVVFRFCYPTGTTLTDKPP
jgi:DNA-binding winged helix-turn-helix (wHTH) protein